MRWDLVWSIAAGLPKGKAYAFSSDDIREAAECQLDSAMDSVRLADIIQFTKNLEEQFNVEMLENPYNGSWVMRK